MTPNQKSFAAWIERFKQVCVDHGGKPVEAWEGAFQYQFRTRFGGLSATMSQADYDCEAKRGAVWVYMKFDHDVDAGELDAHLWGDFNRISGKWNFYFSNGKENLDTSRALAIAELKRRLKFCREIEPLQNTPQKP
jgi:hypothetical protein